MAIFSLQQGVSDSLLAQILVHNYLKQKKGPFFKSPF